MIGSFVGTIVGSFVQNVGEKAILSFATDTGLTLFGLVDQDYSLPKRIIDEMGLETFEYEHPRCMAISSNILTVQ